MLDTTKPVQTRDGRKARILSTEGPAPRSLVVAILWSSGREAIFARYPDGRCSGSGTPSRSDLINVPSEVVRFLNVYDDGTSGSTEHATYENAVDRSKNFKTRIGIMERVTEDGAIKRAKIHPTTPCRRLPWDREGINPYS